MWLCSAVSHLDHQVTFSSSFGRISIANKWPWDRLPKCMVHEHGSLLAATGLSFASSQVQWRTGTAARGAKALGGVGKHPNWSASSLKLATAKSLNMSWRSYLAILWLQQDSLNGVRCKLSAEVICERSLQGSFSLDHNNGRITLKNLLFIPVLSFHSMTSWSAWCVLQVFVPCSPKLVLHAQHHTRRLWASLEVCPCLLHFLPSSEVRGSYDRGFSISP